MRELFSSIKQLSIDLLAQHWEVAMQIYKYYFSKFPRKMLTMYNCERKRKIPIIILSKKNQLKQKNKKPQKKKKQKENIT
ncbi:hypothetical protein A3F06_00800 [candidate division TM6 bacterium RIFCSPHIGHO2_12_FULL_36_22]|nr:MAG: hypothetical protein A3F06_00800 [candidate division TM6 bacterium RIFCSPHIGHO2_12_FULL_36_22]